ncbi:hypothetical protein H4V97_001997 [Flavobacterium sp. CG_23.5]|nr:hypothetical protein [Flavobacterium sp. CG_23.5]
MPNETAIKPILLTNFYNSANQRNAAWITYPTENETHYQNP